jgi:hypothetical protein
MGIPRDIGGRSAFPLGSNLSDRRRACRYPVVFQDSLLGWWQDACFVNEPAHLVDLSTTGCLAELARHSKLTTGQSVWIRPHKSSPAAWKEARVIAVRKPLFGKCTVRISFLVPFEYESFKQLVYGPEHLSNAPHSEALDHEKDEFWKMSRGGNDPADA